MFAAGRPNILLVFTDDQGINDVGCYGSEIPTPNIDRLASEGALFESWYSASSICTPSRFGLLTGRNPSRSKHQLLSALMFMADEHKMTGIQSGETTIAERLRDSGYDTSLIGKWHLGHGDKSLLPTRHGFDSFIGHTGGCIDFFTMTYGVIPDWYHQEEYVSENGYATELITDEAISFLDSRESDADPFFLYLAYNAPHFGKGWSPSTQSPINI
ncbi:MAG: arylsulfatase A-like enzyme, partial [Candidatus Pelagisphaera sp.]